MMAEKDFEIGDLVWAKMKNFPFWPARIVNPPTVKGKTSTSKALQKKKLSAYRKAQHYVFFFGSKDFAWILDENIVPHSEEMLNKLSKKKSSSYTKAIDEIVEASLAIVPKPKHVKKNNVENGDLDKILEIPTFKEDELCKKPRIRIVRRDRPTKPKIDSTVVYKSRPSLDLSKPSIPLKEYIKPTSKKIGFIGLGMMGQRIVRNFLHSGHDVSVWNRTPKKCKKFVNAGAKHLSTPADIVQNCDIIFSCVSGPQASKSLVFGNCGILKGLEKCRFGTKGYIEMTSIDSDASQVIAEAISERGGRYLEAPIIGSLSAAEEGTLLIVCAGDFELFKSCESCFFSTAKSTLYMDCDVGSASKMNLIHSMLMSTSNASLAEKIAVLERHNIPKSKFLEVIQLDSISDPLFSESGQAIVDQNFSTNTTLKYQQQNLHMALALSCSYSQPLRLASASNEL